MTHNDVRRLPDRQLFAPDRQLFTPVVSEFMDVVWEERGARLRAWVQQGYSQAWIARRVGREHRTVARWLKYRTLPLKVG